MEKLKPCLKIALSAVAICICVAAPAGWIAVAETPSAGQGPSPEVQKLGYFVGKWSGAVEVKATQLGPAAKFIEAADSDWMPGGSFIVMNWTETFPTGTGTTLMVLGYDSTEKLYTFNTFQNTGEAASAKGTVDGDTWTFKGTSKLDGKPVQSRFSMKELSPSLCATKLEYSADGANWTTVMEGRITKAK
ncbi:MAG TPA: DUF1579 family protein [Blastocatellia bacterium]|nr:DUF1579 family protein [Blastocatellia bacterium]